MTLIPHSLWLRIVRGEASGPWERLTSAGLRAAAAAYSWGLRAHLAGYRLGIARPTRLPALVVSVGNLTAGGTGKTAAALAVSGWLVERGRRVAYVSRGYRGAGESKALIVSRGFGPLLPAEAAGDEPFMVSRALPGVIVLVGKDRRRTGQMAVQELGADTVVLDDGFQYRRLARDLDIVLVDALLPFGYDLLLPRGLLREPPEQLRRADAVWLTHANLVRRADLEAIQDRVATLAPRARLWQAVHQPTRLRRLSVEHEISPLELKGRRVCALSGLGNPLAFERSLEQLGADVTARLRFPDHHRYQAAELREKLADQSGRWEWVVTTEKDAVRIPTEALEKPTWVLGVELAGMTNESPLSEEMGWLLRAKGKM